MHAIISAQFRIFHFDAPGYGRRIQDRYTGGGGMMAYLVHHKYVTDGALETEDNIDLRLVSVHHSALRTKPAGVRGRAKAAARELEAHAPATPLS